MGYIKYKVGDRVKIQSLERYNKYKNRYGDINYGCETEILFTSEMSSFCGQVVTITRVRYIGCVRFYHLAEDKGVHLWVDGMFEGLVEEETKPKMVNLDDVCNWVENHIFDFPWYDNEHGDFSSKDVANALRKAMEE